MRGMSHFNMDQDVFEIQMIKGCVAAKKPVFGICRGMQLANVAFGGNMIQDIPSQTKSVQAHVGSMDDRDEPFHWVDLKEDSVIRQLMGTDKIMTNSFHHQAVKDIARGFTVTGTAADGIAEAMECMDKKDPLRTVPSGKYGAAVWRFCQSVPLVGGQLSIGRYPL